MTIFEQFKNEYLEKALKPIRYRKLRNRIHEELSAHMDDMYEDFSHECDDELEIVKKIREEMGDATELGIELKEANKRKLFLVRFLKIVFAISALPTLICTISLSMFIIDDTMLYLHAYNLEEAEQFLIDEFNDGKPIKHLIDIEKDGDIHKYYIPSERKETGYDLFSTETIDYLGMDINDKFNGHGASTGNLNNDNIIMLCAGPHNYSDNYYYIFVGPTEEKYIKLYYEPSDYYDTSKSYWSDFIEFPQNGTYEEPVVIYIECPEGYCWSNYERFDENKELIEWD